MSGPTDNGGNAFSAIINGVEHFASDIEQLAEKAVNELANLGISLFNGMNWFIHFLMELREDPVHVISRMAVRIQEIGASLSAVLEEIVDGIRAHGLTGYLRIKVQDSLFPYHNTMNQQVTRSGQLTTVHQETLNTMKKKLDTLTTNGTVPGWQGASVDEMSAAFTFHSTTLNNLNTPFSNQNSLTNQYQQNLAIDNFMALLIGFALLDLLLILCGLVGSVFTFGGAAVLGADILVGVIALEVLILLAYAQTATHSWQNGTSSLYQTQSQRKPDDPVNPTPTPKAFPPVPPLRNNGNDLTADQKRLKEEVKSRLGLTSYDESQIDALIRAGYLDPDAIAAIIRGGNISLFTTGPDVVNLVNTLSSKGIDPNTVIQLKRNGADLQDILNNVQTLLNAKIRIDLINTWLKNGTNLNDAIAILNQGVDLNLIGTSSHVGDFTHTTGASVNEIVSRIPANAGIEHWFSVSGGAQQGMKFLWKDASGKTWEVRMHGIDPSAPAGSNAAIGWVLRVQRGHYFMDADGNFYKDASLKPSSGNYNPNAANITHIPILPP